MIRDILIKQRKLDPDYSKKESVNEKMRPAEKVVETKRIWANLRM